MSYQEHQKRAVDSVVCAIMTISDTRKVANDVGGKLIGELLEEHGHSVCDYAVYPDDQAVIETQIHRLVGDARCQAILMTGGTGVSKRDRSFEAVEQLLEKRLPGFGELFRMLSYQEIGSGAMLSRAAAGVYADRVIFSMPGSVNAVKLAMTRLILPELGHLVSELAR